MQISRPQLTFRWPLLKAPLLNDLQPNLPQESAKHSVEQDELYTYIHARKGTSTGSGDQRPGEASNVPLTHTAGGAKGNHLTELSEHTLPALKTEFWKKSCLTAAPYCSASM